MRMFCATILFLSLCGSSFAAPPPGADPNSPMSKWAQSAKDVNGVGCCSMADCRNVAVQPGSDGALYAYIDKESFGPLAPNDWVKVPEDAKRATSDGPPPDGRAHACFYSGEIHCFFSASGM